MTMNSETAYQPAGYCPKCGYAMDPGVCPECGAQIGARKLSKITLKARRWRRVRWITTLIVAFGLGLGGYHFFNHYRWVDWLPNRCLPWMANRGIASIDEEAMWRMNEGLLEASLCDTLIRGAWGWEANYAQEAPRDTRTRIEIQAVEKGVLATDFLFAMLDYRFITDRDQREPLESATPERDPNQLYAYLHHPDGSTRELPLYYSILGYNGFRLELPALSPGRYTVEVSGQVTVNADVNLESYAIKVPTDLRYAFQVSDKSREQFVKLDYSPELAEQIQSLIRLDIVYLPPDRPNENSWKILEIRLEAPTPIPLAYDQTTIEHTIAGYGAFESTSVFWKTDPNSKSWVDIDPGITSIQKTFNLTLRPSIALALQLGMDHCFGGVIEWENAPLVPDDPTQRMELRIPPTRITRYETADDDE